MQRRREIVHCACSMSRRSWCRKISNMIFDISYSVWRLECKQNSALSSLLWIIEYGRAARSTLTSIINVTVRHAEQKQGEIEREMMPKVAEWLTDWLTVGSSVPLTFASSSTQSTVWHMFGRSLSQAISAATKCTDANWNENKLFFNRNSIWRSKKKKILPFCTKWTAVQHTAADIFAYTRTHMRNTESMRRE